MLDYNEVVRLVSRFLLKHRPGIPFDVDNINVMYDLTGALCKTASLYNFTLIEIGDFLDAVAHNKINTLITDGNVHCFSDLLSPNITNMRLYHAIEHDIMYFKPGKSQTGPGEFATAFYGADVLFTTDPTAGFDLTIAKSTYEYKKIGTNLLTPAKLDSYTASLVLDYIAAIIPVSNAKKPRVRTMYAAGADWRTFLDLRGGRTLVLQNA